MPCFALEPAIHAQPGILYITVPFGFSFGLACADRMYILVGGKAPSVPYLLWCITVFPMKARECCACLVVQCSCSCPLASRLGSVRGLPGSLCSVPCCAVCASVPQCCCRRSGLFGMVARRPLAWRGGSLGPLPLAPPQVFSDPVPWCAIF